MRAIGPPLTPAETLSFIAAARAQLGVRFRHQGRSARGVDCVGVGVVALAAIGREVDDVGAYGREPSRQRLREMLIRNLGEPVPADSMRPGDIPLMQFDGEPAHVGILGDYLYGGLSLIHAYVGARKVIEHRLDETWADRIVDVYRP